MDPVHPRDSLPAPPARARLHVLSEAGHDRAQNHGFPPLGILQSAARGHRRHVSSRTRASSLPTLSFRLERESRSSSRPGEIDVAQSAVSASWTALEKGTSAADAALRPNQPARRLPDRRAPHGPRLPVGTSCSTAASCSCTAGQPQAMLAYAMHLRGVDLAKTEGIDRGGTEEMLQAFRGGEGSGSTSRRPIRNSSRTMAPRRSSRRLER